MKINESARKFFANRRSISVKGLKGPGPGLEDTFKIIESALRVPDHGKLEPWRAILISEKSKYKFIDIIDRRGKEIAIDSGKLEKNKKNVLNTPLIIAVICSPKESPKIPEIEQILSAGALCLNILNNFLVCGWGANWLTGWMAHDRKFGEEAFDLVETEFVAGFIYVGDYGENPPDRPRPNAEDKIVWF